MSEKLLQRSQARRSVVWVGNVDLVGKSHGVAADDGRDVLLLVAHVRQDLSQRVSQQTVQPDLPLMVLLQICMCLNVLFFFFGSIENR